MKKEEEDAKVTVKLNGKNIRGSIVQYGRAMTKALSSVLPDNNTSNDSKDIIRMLFSLIGSSWSKTWRGLARFLFI